MEMKARDSRDSIKDVQRYLKFWPWGWLCAWAVTLALFVGALLVGPSWRTVAAIGLIIAALGVQLAAPKRQVGPCAAVVAGVVVTRTLFLEDSEGRTRAWFGVENCYGDERGARLVLYDGKGQARLSLRAVEENSPEDGREAEVVRTGEDAYESEPDLVMLGKDGEVIWRAP